MEEESLRNNERMFEKNVEKFNKYVEELEKKAKEFLPIHLLLITKLTNIC